MTSCFYDGDLFVALREGGRDFEPDEAAADDD
jgi:hypothetical protein